MCQHNPKSCSNITVVVYSLGTEVTFRNVCLRELRPQTAHGFCKYYRRENSEGKRHVKVLETRQEVTFKFSRQQWEKIKQIFKKFQ